MTDSRDHPQGDSRPDGRTVQGLLARQLSRHLAFFTGGGSGRMLHKISPATLRRRSDVLIRLPQYQQHGGTSSSSIQYGC